MFDVLLTDGRGSGEGGRTSRKCAWRQPVNTGYAARPTSLQDPPSGLSLQMPLRRFSLLWKIQLSLLLV